MGLSLTKSRSVFNTWSEYQRQIGFYIEGMIIESDMINIDESFQLVRYPTINIILKTLHSNIETPHFF